MSFYLNTTGKQKHMTQSYNVIDKETKHIRPKDCKRMTAIHLLTIKKLNT